MNKISFMIFKHLVIIFFRIEIAVIKSISRFFSVSHHIKYNYHSCREDRIMVAKNTNCHKHVIEGKFKYSAQPLKQ